MLFIKVEEAVVKVNEWAEDNTNGLIKEVLSSGLLSQGLYLGMWCIYELQAEIKFSILIEYTRKGTIS